MKQAIKYITVVLAIVLSLNVAVAQTAAQKCADKLYGQKLYNEASVKYAHVVKKDPANKDAAARLGDCYRRLGMYAKAEEAYTTAAAAGELSAQDNLRFALVLAANDKLAEAKKYYAKYSPTVGDGFDDNKLYADSARWKVRIAQGNTWGSDMGPAWYKKGVVFSSARKKGCPFRSTDGSTNSPYYDVYYVADTNNIVWADVKYKPSVNKKGKKLMRYRENDDDTYNTSNDTRTVGYYGKPSLYDSLKNDKAVMELATKLKGINKKYSEGPVVFFPAGDSLIFTRTNTKKSKATKSRLTGLYAGKFDGESVTDIHPLNVNSDQYNVGQPALSPDGKTLYFVSDMTGGQGGTDIYMAKWENGNWGTPVNLGSGINTPGDELFPFVNKAGYLYYSSNGLAGLGGLDIYEAAPAGSGFGAPENLGYPANSQYDDFGYISDIENKYGYLTSNRRRGGLDDDIYKFRHDVTIKLDGIVVEEGTEKPLQYADVKLTPLPPSQNDVITKDDGKFVYYLKRDSVYTLSVNRDAYDPQTIEISTKNMRSGATIVKKVVLSPNKFTVDGSVTTRSTNESVPSATIYIKNKTTGEIKTVVSDGAGNFKYDLDRESDYEIYAEKEGQKTPSVTVSTKGKKVSEVFPIKLAFDEELKLAVIYYDFDKSNIRQDAKEELDQLVSIMKAEPTLRVKASSFADSRGEAEYNDKLSSRRSVAAVNYLVKKGIKKNRIEAQYFGEKNLTNRCMDGVECTEEEHQKNRRTEFIRLPAAPAEAPKTK